MSNTTKIGKHMEELLERRGSEPIEIKDKNIKAVQEDVKTWQTYSPFETYMLWRTAMMAYKQISTKLYEELNEADNTGAFVILAKLCAYDLQLEEIISKTREAIEHLREHNKEGFDNWEDYFIALTDTLHELHPVSHDETEEEDCEETEE